MLKHIVTGMVAGAAGTVALNVVTYADMALRGRPPSSVPSKVAGQLMQRVGVDLSGHGDDDDKAQHRLSGLGALLGYGTGLEIGAAYGVLYPLLKGLPTPLAGAGLGGAAMLASDAPATVLGVTDPTSWSAVDWVSDVVPHLAYGLVTAAVYDAIAGPSAR